MLILPIGQVDLVDYGRMSGCMSVRPAVDYDISPYYLRKLDNYSVCDAHSEAPEIRVRWLSRSRLSIFGFVHDNRTLQLQYDAFLYPYESVGCQSVIVLLSSDVTRQVHELETWRG